MLRKINDMRLSTRIIGLALLVVLSVLVVNYVIFVRGHRRSAEEAMVEKAEAFTAVADQTKQHVAKLNMQGVFRTDELVTEVQQLAAAGKSYTESKVFGTVPVVAGWTAAMDAAKAEGIDFRISSFNARNKSNEPAPGSFEAAVLTDLETQARAGNGDTLARIDTDTNALHFMRAIRLSEDCMMCHGHKGNSYDTDNDGKDILGFTMEDWKVGDVHGAYHVVLPLTPVDQQVASFITTGLMWTVPMAGAAVYIFVLVLRRMFGRPIANLIQRIQLIQKTNDLTQHVDVTSKDEVGQLGECFNGFVGTLRDVLGQVNGSTAEVAAAATQIAASSEETATNMHLQNEQVTQVSAAIEEMAASVSEVAKKAADAAGSAGKAGEAAAQGGQIVQGTVEGMHAISAVVSESTTSVKALGRRSEEIGAVISVINDIADQTNLLALNAAIEAARAGEHGRGFAVVADEVRKLADRTTKATVEVSESIKAIQTETGAAVGRMDAGNEQVAKGVTQAGEAGESLQVIVRAARDVASMIQSIAAATEEQAATSEQISRSIEQINAASRQANEGANQAAEASTQLSLKAEQLRAMVGRFKICG